MSSSSVVTSAIPTAASAGKPKVAALSSYGGNQLKFLGTGVGNEGLKLKLNLKRESTERAKSGFCCKSELWTDLAPATSATYGFLLLGGGLYAYSKSGSKGSLFGGLTGSALMAATYFLMQDEGTKSLGEAIGFGSAFLFSSVFGIRLAASRKLVPAGPLLLLSVSVLTVFLLAYMSNGVPASA